MAKMPRSTARISNAPGALWVPSTPVVIPSLAANTTTNVVVTPVSNKFRNGRGIIAQFSGVLPAGVVFSTAQVTGNNNARTLTFVFGNLTAAPVVPAITIIGAIQE